MSDPDVLHIAEIYYPSGALRSRYARYLSGDGTRWVRHGLCVGYHENGPVSSEGCYEHGLEHGEWSDYHSNGQLAARGNYDRGSETGIWSYRDPEGNLEATEYK
ncbi:toxin-antitoxin system YwqK family antitoxin [Xanthomonas dyei]|uniref:MORN repeat protein n=1 Tax=Xanthomonas dyei TaxID=743699 RepID=A0A2S7BWI9_9XANT|nr:hypothetical protein XdyCFBP7245_22030 [Xanthomonas dyei]